VERSLVTSGGEVERGPRGWRDGECQYLEPNPSRPAQGQSLHWLICLCSPAVAGDKCEVQQQINLFLRKFIGLIRYGDAWRNAIRHIFKELQRFRELRKTLKPKNSARVGWRNRLRRYNLSGWLDHCLLSTGTVFTHRSAPLPHPLPSGKETIKGVKAFNRSLHSAYAFTGSATRLSIFRRYIDIELRQ
jgi:hypothetical protein